MTSRSLDELDAVSARRALMVRDDHPGVLGRRRFLQLMGMGVGAGVALGALDGLLPDGVLDGLAPGGEAWAAPLGATDGIVVLVGFHGGSDGLNTVVPFNDADYLAQHGTLALAAAQLLPLGASVGLHPSLSYLKSLYDRGDVAVVQGVGYPNPDLSHFSSMATWMQGHAAGGAPSSGWLGRWLDGLPTRELLRAAAVGGGLPLNLVGEQARGIAVPPWGMGFGGELSDEALRGYAAVRRFSASSAGRGTWHDTAAAAMRDVIDVGQRVAPVFRRDLPDSDLVRKMTVAARLVNSDLGLRVIDTGFDGFDTHAGQPARLAELLAEFDAGLKAFFTTLDDRFRSRVTVMTYSEFGRTSWANDSSGTDHGTSNNHFVIGAGVRGGLYGAQPSLTGLQRWDRVGFNVDFRAMYGTVIDGWLGGGSSTVLGATYPNLGFFEAAPGSGVATGSVPTTVLGDWVGLNPARLYDSRSAGRMLPLGAGTTGEVQVLGAGGVPASGVTAVALNVTAVGATGASAFNVWPAGGIVSDVANVSVPTGFAMGSLVIAKPGVGGRVSITNDLGSAHCVVDVVGYFRSVAANRLQGLTPFRALDTRNGTGGRTGALAAGGTFELAVRGVGGVPSNADSVVVNVTAVQPSAGGYLTVWPAGQTRPLASQPELSRRGDGAEPGDLQDRHERQGGHLQREWQYARGGGCRGLPVVDCTRQALRRDAAPTARHPARRRRPTRSGGRRVAAGAGGGRGARNRGVGGGPDHRCQVTDREHVRDCMAGWGGKAHHCEPEPADGCRRVESGHRAGGRRRHRESVQPERNARSGGRRGRLVQRLTTAVAWGR